MSYELARQRMVAQQVRVRDVSMPSVLAVLGEVAREQFVPAPCKDVACADTEIPLPHRQVMLRPIIEGKLLQALNPGGGLFIVVGAAPVMNAHLITREVDETRQQYLFQTDIPLLVHVAGDAVFSF